MTFWGRGLSGREILLGEPSEAVFSLEQEAPADLVRALFPADARWEELEEVTVYEGGSPIFRGVVDEQNTLLSAQGLRIELICRGLEAVLLDNEAPPGTISAPSLGTLEARLLAPLGLSLGEGDREKKKGTLTVQKGESCWTVLDRFCRNYFGVSPWVDPEGRVQCRARPGRTVELAQVLQAELCLLPCKRVTQVWQQSSRGSYDTLYKSPYPGRIRRRYASMESRRKPAQVLEEGERESFRLKVTCAGAWWPGRNDLVTVEIPAVGRCEECPIREVQYRMDKNGQRTRWILEKGKTVL